MDAIKLLDDIHESLGNSASSKISSQLDMILQPIIQRINLLANEAVNFHHASTLCDEGGFKISKVAHFQKQTFHTTTITTDGSYLYILVSAVNGGMYKIGTGEKNTVPGKIYLFNGVSKSEEVCWVFIKGKIYLRNSSREFGTLEIICPNTFKMDGLLQIYCPDIFSHPSLQIINKNYPLLTDGEYLYIIGKKLLSEKMGAEKKEEEKLKEPLIEKKENESVEEANKNVGPNSHEEIGNDKKELVAEESKPPVVKDSNTKLAEKKAEREKKKKDLKKNQPGIFIIIIS